YVGETDNKRISAICRMGVAFGRFSDLDDMIDKTGKALASARQMHIDKLDYADSLEDIRPVNIDAHIPDYDYDHEFLAFASTLLSHSIDVRSSVSLLLEITGLRYNIDRILINEYNVEKGMMIEKYLWTEKDGVQSTGNSGWIYTEWDGFMKGFDRHGFMVIDDTGVGFSENDSAFFEEHGIKATINCLLYDKSKLMGYITFCDLKHARQWTDYEKKTLYELSSLIAMILSMSKSARKDKQTIEKLSVDSLTGLMLLPPFMNKASKNYARAKKDSVCALKYIDINNFAYINENFGFLDGNKILTMTADKLREYHLLSCRVNADKFLTYCECPDEESILENTQAICDYINGQLKARFPVSDLRVSMGIYFLRPDVDDIQSGIEKANLVRKQAKTDRNASYAVYTDELHAQKNKEFEIIGSTHNAIKSGEIKTYLQPKYSLTKNEIIGAEALVRWQKPDGTMLRPIDFVPLLERVGYIVDIDFCVYEQVLQCFAKWKKEGRKLLPISVNFSRKHTNNPDFVENICELAEKYDVDKRYIEIEITESTISDNSIILKYLDRLRKSGFKVDIDDFGTGYSSLDMLLEVPVDTVKIDKSFMDKSDSEEGRTYIKQVADLVVALRKDVIFEGVETQNQADFLLDSGYSKIQGYFFGGPVSIEEFERKYMND
ncbi:MAG: GGDEF domain-containing phosphodiesterase, partial [Oscillospiraceae bacterium]|nr:GGDEF domain-containing phosphodiesterase [Oscillospiraceae bacterium]